MNIEELRSYCLNKKGVTEEFPFDEDTLVFKVHGKIFALTSLKKWEEGDWSVNLKCDPTYAVALRDKYPDHVRPGYHMNKTHWNTVRVLESNLSDEQICHLISHSYELVVLKLPKKLRDQF